ncbi:palmitoyl-protein thioesterase precursor [Pseudovirgaria hyperparasitica]|uniref:Palmitoyl-protein thioesterase 1 n=1 Tax=Pseudovirgaria hyperparasitica TaxID=470096 RepID=A0A6A6WJF1_9PEZI|nr:palmitoyl-protein thioesterase precursor [Pseudovirgaria hyperparasitica]KAF2762365.1 palmitoyl-protein thioesterase precursor [Pseudovirgaria hyperparasitica]
MRSIFTALLVPSALAFPSLFSSTDANPLPLVIWHGLGDNFANEGIQDVAALAEEVNPGTYVYIIRLGGDDDPSADRSATFFGNLTTQIEQVCEALRQEPIIGSAPAINALGFSQGGQFLRGYIERCNAPPVKNLVTFGSQHNGIAEFQHCGLTDWLCKGAMALLRGNTWSSFVQNRLVPAQYYRSVNETTGEPTEEYLGFSNFLADINNERDIKNKTYAKNLASLSNFAMYVFANDTVAIPKESGHFAQVTNLTNGTVTPLQDRRIYKEDWIGLKKLDKKGALHFKNVEGEHMHLNDEDLRQAFKEFFGPTSKSALGKVQEYLKYQELK